MARVAIVGAGSWGINHVRAFAQIAAADVRAVCDSSDAALSNAAKLAPRARLEKSYEAVLSAPDVDAVVIATPAKLHAPMALAALGAGKHVLVEKPLAFRAADAEAVTAAAERADRVLLVGHLLLYHPAVQRMREGILAGEIGEVQYLSSVRVNLGTRRRDENAMWTLAPHDVSVMLHLLGKDPISASARGAACLWPDVQDVVFVSLRFPGGVLAQIQTSWLNPRKERRIVVVGSRKMMEFDDVAQADKLRIHDKGTDRDSPHPEYDERSVASNGRVELPQIPEGLPLDAECRHFLECVTRGKRPLTDGRSAVRVVRVLEAAQRSLAQDGAPAIIDSAD